MKFPRPNPVLLPAAVSGLLLALAYPKFDLSILGWLALSPLLWTLIGDSAAPSAVRETSARRVRPFTIGWTAGFVFCLGSLYWLLSIPIVPQYFYVFLFIGYVLLSAYLALYFGVWAAGFAAMTRVIGTDTASKRILIAALSAALWSGSEWIRSWMLGGFPWNFLGVSQYRTLPLIQIASITGVYGVSFWLCFVNVALTFAARRIFFRAMGKEVPVASTRPLSQWSAQISWEFTTAMLLVMATAWLGVRQMTATSQMDSQPLKIALVQGNVPQLTKEDPDFARKILDDYLRMTHEAAASGARLIIWPETSTPPDPTPALRMLVTQPDGSVEKRYFKNYFSLSNLAQETHAYLLIGSLDITGEQATQRTGGYNAAFLFPPSGEVGEPYHKMRLVPFGEYVPLERWLPFLKSFTPIPGSFAAGEEFRLFTLDNPSITFANVICFEDIMPDHCREFVKRGAQFLVTITNDAWFKRSAGAYQHTANSVFRAVENRRPLLRCANTGMTCVVNENGGIISALREEGGNDIFIQGTLLHDLQVPVNAPQTFYTRHGDVFAVSCLMISTATWLGCVLTLRRKNHSR